MRKAKQVLFGLLFFAFAAIVSVPAQDDDPEIWVNFECNTEIGCVDAGFVACGQAGGGICLIIGGHFVYCTPQAQFICKPLGIERQHGCWGWNPITSTPCTCSVWDCVGIL